MEVLCGSRVNLVSGCLIWLKRSRLFEATAIRGDFSNAHCYVKGLLKTTIITHTPKTTLPHNCGWQLSAPHWSCLQGNTEWGSKGIKWHSGLSYPIWNNKGLLVWKGNEAHHPFNSSVSNDVCYWSSRTEKKDDPEGDIRSDMGTARRNWEYLPLKTFKTRSDPVRYMCYKCPLVAIWWMVWKACVCMSGF